MEWIETCCSYSVGTRQVPEGPSVPTTDVAIDLFDPKSSMRFTDFSLQSFAYPCCNYWLHRSYVGVGWSHIIFFILVLVDNFNQWSCSFQSHCQEIVVSGIWCSSVFDWLWSEGKYSTRQRYCWQLQATISIQGPKRNADWGALPGILWKKTVLHLGWSTTNPSREQTATVQVRSVPGIYHV